ncbi:EF-hand domain-containing protein [Nocardia aurantia]|uniref:EF-hand domain-containing protein n=1 Tax=Nocardia aurantia TaxID=2585199 RepID=A0A7K0DGT5_9NOCA|nr:hypothetical protein [Nocardia aurantia]
MANAKQIFDEIDTDTDGYISCAELKAHLDNKRSVSDSAASRYFNLLDKDDDDQISFAEFEQSHLSRN